MSVITSDLTRRRFGFGLAAAGLGAALAACSTEEASSAPDIVGRVPFGYSQNSVEIPRDPQRVVSIQGRADLEFGLLAGYTMVASGASFLPNEPVGVQFGSLVPTELPRLGLGDGTDVDYEQLLGLEPDLILVPSYGYEVDWYGNDRLRQIAPVAPISDNFIGWREDLTAQLATLGRPGVGPELFADYNASVASIRSELSGALSGKRVAMAAAGETDLFIQQNGIQVSTAMDVGLVVPHYDPTADGGLQIAQENFDRLQDIDVMILQVNDGSGQVPDLGPTWNLLPFVQAGRVHVIDGRFNQGFVVTATNYLSQIRTAAGLIA
ncbi:ABC transporter substrate-binding protein [Rhodococcoides kyotonense]|uniref:ABC-type Fe3+-hydroxamate transport system, substrate-binding protein n=1 Tax=Rhodococcoides kyotonense TaxID=398843 RepID=A0A239L6G0_9NOCA|nr:ABC transporter substrate-binding protein [Rhodococcus kyotonensis]SNT25880.1 ABC-type Fe3+-hydroxamate transport system, substrate-binding protein [Rhodococcus kyotonensis]